MTTQSNADLREAIEAIVLSTARFGEVSDKIDQIIRLFQAREQQLLSELLGELPDHKKQKDLPAPLDVEDVGNIGKAVGFNKAIDQVIEVIERFLQGEQLDSLNDGTESRPPDQNKTNDGGRDGGL